MRNFAEAWSEYQDEDGPEDEAPKPHEFDRNPDADDEMNEDEDDEMNEDELADYEARRPDPRVTGEDENGNPTYF